MSVVVIWGTENSSVNKAEWMFVYVCHLNGWSFTYMVTWIFCDWILKLSCVCTFCRTHTHTEGFLSKRFKYVYVQLYSDSHFVWYRSQYSTKPDGLVFLAVRHVVCLCIFRVYYLVFTLCRRSCRDNVTSYLCVSMCVCVCLPVSRISQKNCWWIWTKFCEITGD